MKKRTIGMLAAICLIVPIAAGCSGMNKNKGSAPEAETAEPAPPAAAPSTESETIPPAAIGWTDINPRQLNEMLAAGKDIVILDVRNPEELVSGPAPIKNALNIPVAELPQRYVELPRDKDIAVVCRTGRRSAAAADFLVKTGFKNVYNLIGGMTDYRQVYSQ